MSIIEKHCWSIIAVTFIAAIAIGVFSGEALKAPQTVCRHGFVYDPYYGAQVIGPNGGGIPCVGTEK